MDDLDALVPEIVAGDTDAFGRFMSRVELALRGRLRPFAARVDVEAVVQEAFLRLWQVAPRFVPDGRDNGFFRLACRIAHNLALDELKRRRERPAFEDGASEEIEGAWLDVDPLLRALILECFEKLPAKPRQALRARLDDEGAENDTTLAVRVGMTTNTFLQNITRARAKIADCLESKGVKGLGSRGVR